MPKDQIIDSKSFIFLNPRPAQEHRNKRLFHPFHDWTSLGHSQREVQFHRASLQCPGYQAKPIRIAWGVLHKALYYLSQ